MLLAHLWDMTIMQPRASEVVEALDAGMTDADLLVDLQAVHGAALYDFARHQGLTDDQAADAVQEALLRLWRELQRGTIIERPPAWMFRTVYHLAMGQHRWRRQLALLLPRLAPRRTDYAGPEASDRLSVWGAVDHLPERQRQVLYLHYAADLPFEEIAGVLGVSASAARTHASRGLATLRRDLTREVIS
jgi:RNA polymerase sigma factor (sigma-70 family)